MFQTIEKAIQDLQAGKMIIVVDDEDRENEGDFVLLAEHATPENINFMAQEGRGLICTPMDLAFAKKFELNAMVSNNTDAHGTAFTVSVDHKDTTTGISAYERALTIQKFIDPETVASDFKRPGHVFPLMAKDAGVLERPGHTEAAVDFARLAGSSPVGVICEIMNPDGTMARLPELEKLAEEHDMALITIQALIDYRKKKDKLINKEIEINLPTEYGQFKLAAYTETFTGKEHLALYKGDLSENEPTLVRIHSECLTGDVLGSHRCDCGPQLEKALLQIEEAGKGVLVYMRQEGRGIGLLNKLKAYKLQEKGFDTVEANHQLGFPDDLRDYAVSAQILKDLGVKKIRLLTNNPRKISSMGDYGLEVVEREAIQIPTNKDNENYLKTKVAKLDHLLKF
ncbi:bifunctional 3,4-dihydroxy-2-butanone-4-phosphate synthase/GTP cyclohydrolase II [Aquibacillus koreensis]|uniref:Riboflavin biosynthesis protein RibBA n=1 Tax=Aquibacillus koreensis TaxID=279446 RepID=A0A9X4AJU7_9BACI|nr:bifunctional 3,4-dihydroxy-2-butanone-4-phosphate synthase/GTP cyclohydrolase II [Aquibacillus koreensis]MCT2534907.1 bifunctional 3,4-dihydroxy-2-butanone-4-phosphate synthase/GTP cyclohydrolase II [Aquibacillus koreensis]MDC3422199.1 bifunctional 3,4-dihydroxy-2-butanone-4-phosphate synthase/GTP cyclohydrolase II [Aquibacillus koreensis]